MQKLLKTILLAGCMGLGGLGGEGRFTQPAGPAHHRHPPAISRQTVQQGELAVPAPHPRRRYRRPQGGIDRGGRHPLPRRRRTACRRAGLRTAGERRAYREIGRLSSAMVPPTTLAV